MEPERERVCVRARAHTFRCYTKKAASGDVGPTLLLRRWRRRRLASVLLFAFSGFLFSRCFQRLLLGLFLGVLCFSHDDWVCRS